MTKALIDRIDAALARADDNAGYEAFVLLRKNWPTIREALAAQPQATIDSIPSRGQENDYQRAQPQSSLEALQTIVDLIAGGEVVDAASFDAMEDALLVSTTMLEALLVQLNSWGHESAVNARGQIFRNEELLAVVGCPSQREGS
jgi:hypothetical protein